MLETVYSRCFFKFEKKTYVVYNVKRIRNHNIIHKTMERMHGAYQKKNNRKNKIFIIIGLCVIFVIAGIFFLKGNGEDVWVCENGAWVKHGKPKDPKPETGCGDNTGQMAGEREKPQAEYIEADSKRVAEGIDIRIMEPHVNQTITSPLKVKGEAKDWFVDGTLNVKLIDAKGATIAQTTANLKDKEGSDYKEFEAELTFDKGDVKSGDIVFQKNNPTNDPAQARSFSFPVFFE